MAYQYLGTPVTAFIVLTILTWAAVTVSGTTQELSTTTGDTVNIPCLFGEGTLSSIFWSYNDGTGRHKILSFANRGLTIEPEYANKASLQDDYSTLILKGITVADEGTYRCDVDRLWQTVVFNITSKLNVFSLRPGTFPVISPCTLVDDFSSCISHANQSFNLTCTLPSVYPVEDTELIWFQNGKRASSTNDFTQNADGTTDINEQIQVSETGNLTCNVTYRSANGKENTGMSVKAWIIPSADTTGKNMTAGQIVGIYIVLLVGIFILLFICRSKVKGQLSSTNDELSQVISAEELALLETSTENGIEDENVESSTSPPSSSVRRRNLNRIVSEEEFIKLSKLIEPSFYTEVGVNLEIPDAELGQILVQHRLNYSDALMAVFIRWRDKQPPGTDIRALLSEGLERSDLGFLSGKLLDGSIVLMPIDFDDILVAVGKKIRKNLEIDALGRKLGFTPEDIHGYIVTNHRTQNITFDGTLQMLRDWRDGQRYSTERGALKTALEQSGQIRLADDLFP